MWGALGKTAVGSGSLGETHLHSSGGDCGACPQPSTFSLHSSPLLISGPALASTQPGPELSPLLLLGRAGAGLGTLPLSAPELEHSRRTEGKLEQQKVRGAAGVQGVEGQAQGGRWHIRAGG